MSHINLTLFTRLLLYIVPAFKERKPCAETKDCLLVRVLLHPYNATKRIIVTANLFRNFSVFVFLTAGQNVCLFPRKQVAFALHPIMWGSSIISLAFLIVPYFLQLFQKRQNLKIYFI